MAERVRSLVEALFAAAEDGSGEVVVERRFWGDVMEPFPQRVGVKEYRGEGFRLRVGRVGGIYGYLEAELGNCRMSGVVVYGQAGFRVRVSRLEGEGCRGPGAGGAPGVYSGER